MAMIYVKAREGRRAYFEGRVIPQDKFVPVTDTPYIRRLINHHQDLEEDKSRAKGPPQTRGPKGREAPPRPESPTSPKPAKDLPSGG